MKTIKYHPDLNNAELKECESSISEIAWQPSKLCKVPIARLRFISGNIEYVAFNHLSCSSKIHTLLRLRCGISQKKQVNWESFWIRFAWSFDCIDISKARRRSITLNVIFWGVAVFYYFAYLLGFMYGIDEILFGHSCEAAGIWKFLVSVAVVSVITFLVFSFPFKGKYIANRIYRQYYLFPNIKQSKSIFAMVILSITGLTIISSHVIFYEYYRLILMLLIINAAIIFVVLWTVVYRIVCVARIMSGQMDNSNLIRRHRKTTVSYSLLLERYLGMRPRATVQLCQENFLKKMSLSTSFHHIPKPLDSDAISGENPEVEQIDAKESVDEPIEK